jgi:CRP/FNR family transcriptional regulator, cyclic AMP receptor protein
VSELFDKLGRTFTTGTVLFREGDPGEEMYVIQTGRVQLTRRVRGREAHLATLPPGEFFGEMAIVNNRPRSATATVMEDAQLLVIDARTFEAMVRGNAEIALRFIKKLAARLAQANAQVEVLLLQDLNHRVVHHLRHLANTRGTPDGPGVRVTTSIDDVAEMVGAKYEDVDACVRRLQEAKLFYRDGDQILIAEVGKLDQFLEFLEMKENFGG